MDLLKKLKIKADKPLWLVNAPAGIAALLPGQQITEKAPGSKPAPQIMLFVHDSTALEQNMLQLHEWIGHDTLLWVCYPKKTGALASDLTLMKSWAQVFAAGYRGQASAAISKDWTGLRITSAPRQEPSQYDIPMEERKIEGIDFVNRTTTLPPDAAALVGVHKGMAACFHALSFTHQKEYIMGLVEAKKPETRLKRIEKMIAALAQKMHVQESRQPAKR